MRAPEITAPDGSFTVPEIVAANNTAEPTKQNVTRAAALMGRDRRTPAIESLMPQVMFIQYARRRLDSITVSKQHRNGQKDGFYGLSLGIQRGTVRRYSSYDSPKCCASVGSS